MVLHLADELRRRRHWVLPVVPNAGSGWLDRQFRDRGFSPETIHLRRPLDWGCLRSLAGLLRKHGIDCVHSHEFSMVVYGAAAARWAGIPHVATLHSASYGIAKWRRRVALRWAFRHSRAVTVSAATKSALAAGLRIQPQSIDVVRNGIPFHAGERDRVRRELCIAADDLLIVAVGNLYPVKGHIVLLRALAELCRRRPGLSWHLAIAGKVTLSGNVEEEAAAFREFAERHGFSERFHLLGYRQDVPDILAAADIYAMPSLSEGLPLGLLEAMFAGKPIVASAVGGIPEVIENGREGLLTPAGDHGALATSLERLGGSPETRGRLGREAASRAAREFSLEVMVDAYERLYEAALPTGFA